jgi:ParB family chromosome partitioning protein
MKEQIKDIPVTDLYPFPNNPFSVGEDVELQDSIHDYGVIAPLVVRPRAEGGYEIISGHRRKAACEAAGIDTVPAFVRELDDTAAVIALVDSNLHREHVLPSEKAHAYKLKLDAIKKQGQRADLSPDSTCGQAAHKSRDEIADSESGRQVQRYIRLCELIPTILAMVDEGKIAFSPAVELSYLPKKEQENLLETMESEDRTPSHSQAIRMRKLSADGALDMDTVFAIMTEEKPNQKEQIKLKAESIQRFFPKGYTTRQMHDKIVELLGQWQLRRERAKNDRDTR